MGHILSGKLKHRTTCEFCGLTGLVYQFWTAKMDSFENQVFNACPECLYKMLKNKSLNNSEMIIEEIDDLFSKLISIIKKCPRCVYCEARDLLMKYGEKSNQSCRIKNWEVKIERKNPARGWQNN